MAKTHSFRSNITCALTSKGFCLGVLGMALVVLLSCVQGTIELVRNMDGLLQNGAHGALILQALEDDLVMMALPILCTLAYTTSMVDDVKCGYIKAYLPRAGRKQYVRSKIVSCALSGALTVFLGIWLAYLVSTIVFTPMEAALTQGQLAQQHVAQVLSKALLYACSGALWALIGCLLCVWTKSRYMAHAGPFLVYYVLVILYERYVALYLIYPKEWLHPEAAWVLGDGGVMLFMACWIAIVAMGCTILAKRQLEQV